MANKRSNKFQYTMLLLKKASSLTLITVLTLVLIIGSFYASQKLQFEQQFNLIRKMDEAQNDFSHGLIHLSLASDKTTPWQRETGITLIKQSLVSFKEIAAGLEQNPQTMSLSTIDALSSALNTLITNNYSYDTTFSQNVYLMRKHNTVLSRELAKQLEKKRINQSAWFAATVFFGTISLTLLVSALLKLRKKRNVLISDLMRSQQRFYKLLQNTDEVFWLERFEDKKLVYVSPSFERFTGINVTSLMRVKNAWKKLVHKNDVEAIQAARDEAQHSTQDLEYRFVQTNGEIRWMEGRIFPIWATHENNTEQNPEYLGVVVRDVTRKREYINAQAQNQKMDSLGHLTGGIAHDFNNLLTVILTNSQLLHGQLKSMPQQAYIVDLISRAATRGANLTKQLLTFASKRELFPETLIIDMLVKDSVELLNATLSDQIRISVNQIDQNLWVKIDPGQFQSALLNMCLNSRDAMPKGGEIVITLGLSKKTQLDSATNALVEIVVSDNGEGIADDDIDRVFDPFFSTKMSTNGTGLGLSMVYGFVRQSRGLITIESKQNQGTSISMLFPQQRRAVTKITHRTQPRDYEGCTILFVEDDEMVRQSVTMSLQQDGFKVIDAQCVQDARVILDSKWQIDMLITDVQFPTTAKTVPSLAGARGEEHLIEDGYALANYVETKHKHIKILVISGYVGDAHSPLSKYAFLQKPFTQAQMNQKIAHLFNQ